MISKGYLTNITTILLLVCTGFLSSCNKEEVAISKNYPVEVNVTETTDTKISTNGENLFWQEGDQLSLFAASANNSYTGSTTLELNSIDAGSATGKFRGEISLSDERGEISLSDEPKMCYFTHPSSCTPSYADSKVSAVFDYSAQDGTHKPFLWGKAAYPTGGGVLNCTLSHVGGMVYLENIPSEVKVTSITIKGNSGENLSPVDVNLSNGEISVGSEKEFDVNISGTTAYICMPPVNFSKGFSIIYNSASGSMYKSYSSKGTADSGYDFSDVFGKYVTIDAGGNFTPLVVTSDASYTHTTDTDGYLTGTQVIATPNLQGAPAKITTWGAELIHPDGSTVVRTISPNNNFSASSMNVTDGWEYLPAGTYKYKFYYTLNNQETENVVTTDLIIKKATDPVKISLSGEIEHIYDNASGIRILKGSTATVTVTATNNSNLPITSITSWSATLVNSENPEVEVRGISGKTSSGTFEFSGEGYISSQETYTLKLVGTCIVKGDELNCASASEIEADEPEITVTPNFETSYTRYLAGALDKANASGTGNKVMNISVSVNVSENLLSQYDNSLTFTYDGLSMLTNNGSKITTRTLYPNTLQNNEGLLEGKGTASATIISQVPDQHTIAASFTFDGITATASEPCHVTGIPYESPYLDGNDDKRPQLINDGWILNGTVSWENNGLRIYYYYNYLFGTTKEFGWVLSPTFSLPQSIGIRYLIEVIHYTTTHDSGDKARLYYGITNNNEKVQTNDYKDLTPGEYSNKEDGINHIEKNVSGFSSSHRISISHNEASLKDNRAEWYIILKSLKIYYN